MEQTHSFHRPLLKTRGFSTFHIYLFELILLGKTNREINKMIGYSQKSHIVVDHSKKVMHKLLCYENLSREEYSEKITYPRRHLFWWTRLLNKHKETLLNTAIEPKYYAEKAVFTYS